MLFKIETAHVWKPGFHVWKSEPLFLSKSRFSSSKSPTGVFLQLPKKTDNKTAPPESCVISASKESNLQTIVGTIELQSQGLDSKVEHEAGIDGIDQACLKESWIWSSPKPPAMLVEVAWNRWVEGPGCPDENSGAHWKQKNDEQPSKSVKQFFSF